MKKENFSSKEMKNKDKQDLKEKQNKCPNSIKELKTDIIFEILLSTDHISQGKRDKILDPILKSFETESSSLEEGIIHILKMLTTDQKEVVHDIFWKNLSLSEISKKRNINKVSAYGIKKRALQKISNQLLQFVIRKHLNRKIAGSTSNSTVA